MQTIEEVLRTAGLLIAGFLSNHRVVAIISDSELVDYHGFGKWRFPKKLTKHALGGMNLDVDKLQVEIIRVTTDLRHEVHLHKEAYAVTIVLGNWHHFLNPLFAQAYIGEQWEEVAENQVINIPPHTPHGFTVNGKGVLYFLSIQTPPIVGDDGRDDYFLAPPAAKEPPDWEISGSLNWLSKESVVKYRAVYGRLSATHTPISHPDLNAKRKGAEGSSLNFLKNGGY